ncbi:hypothetical protein MAPG_06152 [Magnaporthiopsis poae ATCC 64411]|uniref:Rhodopsin domain-containing protein n=1 Tax=Magnaporthiopsis poae (strain ATCC 64411 / 73-15) TaxID=644358 RepID=A0A0C4E198_MAGP6|nr:hypothetical protein MAPG_06152 [Magnaporthiopsis poae ATCC 64411]
MSSNSTAALADRRNEDRASDGVPISIICPAIALTLVALRVYTRAFLVKKVFLEDYTIIAAMAFSIFVSVFIVIAFSNGAGRHFETVSAEEFGRIRRFTPAVHIGYNATQTLLKLSIVFQYIRISVMPFEKRLCYGFAALIICGFISFFITALLTCIPIYAMWTPNVPGAVCINTSISFPANQIYHIVSDFTLLVGPFFILRHLTIPWPQRILLGLVLALGALASTVSVLRLQVLKRSATSTDKTWDSVPSGLYSIIEINVGIACSCIVTLRPLFGQWRWLSGGAKKELPPAITPGQKAPRPRDPFSVGTDSTQVLTVPDVELGTVYTASCGGSTTVGSRSEGKDGDAVSPAWPNPPPAAQCRPRSRPDDGQDHHQSSVTEDSGHPRSQGAWPREKW